MAILDVEKAFDFMHHGAIMQLLIKRGWTVAGVSVLMHHMQGMTAKMELEGIPPMPSVPYHMGGRQGGAETAVVFADIMEAIIEDEVDRWNDHRRQNIAR